jgi:hypothetical protein
MELTVQIDEAQMQELRKEFEDLPKVLTRATVLAINKTSRSMRTRIVRTMSGFINLTRKEIRNRNVFQHLANYDSLRAEINVRGGRMLLYKFAPHPSRMNPFAQRWLPGTSVEVLRGDRTDVDHAFTAEMASGHVGVFRRQGRGRLHIDEVRTAENIPQMMDRAGLDGNSIELQADGELEKNLGVQIQLILERRGYQPPADAAGPEDES